MNKDEDFFDFSSSFLSQFMLLKLKFYKRLEISFTKLIQCLSAKMYIIAVVHRLIVRFQPFRFYKTCLGVILYNPADFL